MSLIKNKKEDWQQHHINALTLKMIFAATIGTAVAFALTYALKLSNIDSSLLFIPWGIVLVLGISKAFQEGVLAERHRIEKANSESVQTAEDISKTTP